MLNSLPLTLSVPKAFSDEFKSTFYKVFYYFKDIKPKTFGVYSKYVEKIFQLQLNMVYLVDNEGLDIYDEVKNNLKDIFVALARFTFVQKEQRFKTAALELLNSIVEFSSAEYILKLLDESELRSCLLEAICIAMSASQMNLKKIGVNIYNRLCTSFYKKFIPMHQRSDDENTFLELCQKHLIYIVSNDENVGLRKLALSNCDFNPRNTNHLLQRLVDVEDKVRIAIYNRMAE